MTTLYPYQRRGVRRLAQLRGRALLADEMGLGKTLQVLTLLHKYPKRTLPALVVCPASAKFVWQDQALEHIGIQGQVLSGTRPWTPKRTRLTIINYDILNAWRSRLIRMKYKTLVLDECHYIKKFGTNKHPVQRTRAAMALGRRIPNVIGVTGTPILTHPDNLFNILHLIDPDYWGGRGEFRWQYCNPKKTPWGGGWDYSGFSHVDELHRRLKENCMIRRTKKTVLTQLPEKTRMVVRLGVSRPDEYAKARDAFLDWLEHRDEEKAERAARAEHLTKIGYLLRLASELKMMEALAWIKDHLEGNDKKLVVFFKHRIVHTLLKETFRHQCVSVTGDTTQLARQQAVRRFQRDSSVRLFLGNLHAAGTAITLTAADTVAFMEMSWVPGEMLQAEDRVHRIGQKWPVTAYYLVASGTVEERLCRVLHQRLTNINRVIDGKHPDDEMTIYELLSIQERMLK